METKKIGRVATEMRRLHVTAVANRRGLSRLSTLVEAREKKNKIIPTEVITLQEPGKVRDIFLCYFCYLSQVDYD